MIQYHVALTRLGWRLFRCGSIRSSAHKLPRWVIWRSICATWYVRIWGPRFCSDGKSIGFLYSLVFSWSTVDSLEAENIIDFNYLKIKSIINWNCQEVYWQSILLPSWAGYSLSPRSNGFYTNVQEHRIRVRAPPIMRPTFFKWYNNTR